MHLRTIQAPVLGATCALLVDDAGHALVVDAGGGVGGTVLDLVAAEGWVPVGVAATHGHVDHVWDAPVLCRAWDLPLHIHEADVYRLADPFGTLGPLGAQILQGAGVPAPEEPPRVRTTPWPPHVLTELDVGLTEPVSALHVPGHTEGSTCYLATVDGRPTMLAGDVLFAGSIGRTDLPGGDGRRMTASLVVLAALDPETIVVPGHGPTTTIGAELATNPYLRAAR